MPAKKERVPITPAPAAKKKPPTKQLAESASAKQYSALDAAALVRRESGQPARSRRSRKGFKTTRWVTSLSICPASEGWHIRVKRPEFRSIRFDQGRPAVQFRPRQGAQRGGSLRQIA